MKKKILTLISIIALVFGLSALIVACGEEKIEYSAIVVSPTEEPVSDVTVSWMTGSKVSGKATTGADGVAKASLPAGTYSIALSGSGLDGYDYDEEELPMPTAAMPDIMIELSVKKVTYSVTVIDKDTHKVPNVTVTWSNGSKSATATTDANGKAECKLDYGEYTVSLDNATLPAENVCDEALTVTGKNPSVTFNLRAPAGAMLDYTVTVQSEGGLRFKNSLVMVLKSNGRPLTSGATNDEGVFSFRAEAGTYTASLMDIPNGYSGDTVTLTEGETSNKLVLYSQIISGTPADTTKYLMGDIFHDYVFTTPYELNGAVWSKSVSEILKTKEVLIINNWGTNCTWCVTEMPDMETVYKKYEDQIEIVAVDNYGGGDSEEVISAYYDEHKYSFPMVRDNTYNFAYKFGITGWPTTIVIDRYGAIARIEKGAITSLEAWERMISKYIGDDYEQTFTPGEDVSDSIVFEVAKPDFKVDKDHYENLGNAILEKDYTLPEGTSIKWYGDTNEDDYWPFLFGKFNNLGSGDDYVLFAANGTSSPTEELYGKTEREGKANSMAILYADVTVKAGQALTFQYFADTEKSDILHILWDGRIIRSISGDSEGWQTCYLYSEITDGSHKLSITYIKDTSGNSEKDNVFIRNLKFVNVMDITKSSDMLRGAGFGDIVGGKFSHYADVSLESDGYYHVDIKKLETGLSLPAGLAGNDEKPLLLANLMNKTPWNNQYSISELVYGVDESGNYAFSCEFDLDGSGVKKNYRNEIIKYLQAAAASDVAYCVPVNETLHKLLVAFMAQVSGSDSHEKEWLEICYFYSHYGDGSPVGNPILGVMEETAIKAELDATNHANLTRAMAPFPSLVYEFTPDEDAVYKIESFLSGELDLAAQIWLYDDPSEFEKDHYLAYDGEYRMNRDAKNEQNFEIYYYMTKGHRYYVRVAFLMAASGEYDFKITKIGQTYTKLVPASADTYQMVLDSEGNFSGEIELINAVEYELRADGYYHVKNSSAADDLIYLDVKYANTTALGTIPLERLCNYIDNDPFGNRLDYKMFDFHYYLTLHTELDGDVEIATYDPDTDAKIAIENLKYYDSVTNSLLPISSNEAKFATYKDYSEILQKYIDEAPKSGDKEGLIPVTQELVDMLTAFVELRSELLYDNIVEFAKENEWLRFCWHYETHDVDHP